MSEPAAEQNGAPAEDGAVQEEAKTANATAESGDTKETAAAGGAGEAVIDVPMSVEGADDTADRTQDQVSEIEHDKAGGEAEFVPQDLPADKQAAPAPAEAKPEEPAAKDASKEEPKPEPPPAEAKPEPPPVAAKPERPAEPKAEPSAPEPKPEAPPVEPKPTPEPAEAKAEPEPPAPEPEPAKPESKPEAKTAAEPKPEPEKPKPAEPEKAKPAEPEKPKAPEPEKSKAPEPEKPKPAEPEKKKPAEPEKPKAPEPEKSKAPEPEKPKPAEPKKPKPAPAEPEKAKSNPEPEPQPAKEPEPAAPEAVEEVKMVETVEEAPCTKAEAPITYEEKPPAEPTEEPAPPAAEHEPAAEEPAPRPAPRREAHAADRPRGRAKRSPSPPYDPHKIYRPPPQVSKHEPYSTWAPRLEKPLQNSYIDYSWAAFNPERKYRRLAEHTADYVTPAKPTFVTEFNDLVSSGPFSRSMWSTQRLMGRSRSHSRDRSSAHTRNRFETGRLVPPLGSRPRFQSVPPALLERGPGLQRSSSYSGFMDYVDQKHGELYRSRSQSRLEQKLGLRAGEGYERIPHMLSTYEPRPTVNRYVWHMHDNYYCPRRYDITTRYDSYRPLASSAHYRPPPLDFHAASRTFAHDLHRPPIHHVYSSLRTYGSHYHPIERQRDRIVGDLRRDLSSIMARSYERIRGPTNRAPYLSHRLSEQAGSDFLASNRYRYKSYFT